MSHTPHQLLDIYTASAGAGKTYTLSLCFLEYILGENAPGGFRHVLAVTFTNKATAEMKERIIDALAEVAADSTPSALRTRIAGTFSLSEKVIAERAGKELTRLLSDYSAFRVKTIDSFFQEIVHAFAWELGLPMNYRVELGTEIILHRAAVRLLYEMEHSNKRGNLAAWLSNMARDKTQEGGSYNLLQTLETLGKELFKDGPRREYMGAGKHFPPREEIERLYTRLHTRRKALIDERNAIVVKFFDTLTAAYSTADFYQGKSSGLNIFTKLREDQYDLSWPNSYFRKEKRLVPAKNVTIPSAILEDLGPIVEDLEQFYYGQEKGSSPIKMGELLAIDATLEQLRLMGLLSDLQDHIERESRESHRLLLSGAEDFIGRIIADQSTPFIYERFGTQLDHIMIDEFQDTGRIQYANLKPLLQNALDAHNRCMIVGDVKQSIYKFRFCDRNILAEQVPADFTDFIESKTLDYNWRSSPAVVEFNNALFEQMPLFVAAELQESLRTLVPYLSSTQIDKLAGKIRETYQTVTQEVPPSKVTVSKGGVEVVKLSIEEEAKRLEEIHGHAPKKGDYLALVMDSLITKVLELVCEKGYEPREIAILLRNNKEISRIADAFTQYSDMYPEYRAALQFTSSEALKMTNSPLVRCIVLVLRALCEPNNATRKKIALQSFLETQPASSTNFDDLLAELIQKKGVLSLYDLVLETINSLYPQPEPNDLPYLYSLLDLTASFHRDEVADLWGFLEMWDRKGFKQDLPASEGENAITLLSIHKSKGLGFPIVLLPNPTWELGFNPMHYPIVWTQAPQQLPSTAPISLLPIRISNQTARSYYAPAYAEELTDQIIDNLNLFYVAMTRAKKGLVVWLCEKGSSKGNKAESLFNVHIHDLLALALPQESLYTSIPDNTDKKRQSEISPSLPVALLTPREEAPKAREFAIKLVARRAYRDNEAISYGEAMHYVMSKINTLEDVPIAVDSALSLGFLSSKLRSTLIETVEAAIASPDVEEWFHPGVITFREQPILLPGGKHYYQPDRVVVQENGTATVIDYKFGQKKGVHYHQVAGYMQLLLHMGYPRVEGYLWYFQDNHHELVEVQTSQSSYQTNH